MPRYDFHVDAKRYFQNLDPDPGPRLWKTWIQRNPEKHEINMGGIKKYVLPCAMWFVL